MSRIDELIAQHCTDGVRFVQLGDVVRIKNGSDYKSLGAGSVPVYGSGGVMTTVDTAVHQGPSVLIPRKGSLGNLFYVEEPFWTVDTIFYTEIDENVLNPKFFYHLMFLQRLAEKNQAGGVPSMTQSYLKRISIPVPPLEVQRAIVEVLETFSKLEAELEAELEARKQQYEHYREQLLTPVENVDSLPLGDLVRIRNGKDHKHLAEGGVPVYGSGGVMRYVDTASAHGPSVLIPRKGSLGNLFYVEGPFWNVDTIFSTEIDASKIEPKFLFHQLSVMKLGEMNQAGGVPSQTQSALNRLRISVPTLDEQRRIVEILDKFDALVNDLSSGLPAEIAARRQQYEYYRDKLLTFKELEAAA